MRQFAVAHEIVNEKGFTFYAQPQSGAYSLFLFPLKASFSA